MRNVLNYFLVHLSKFSLSFKKPSLTVQFPYIHRQIPNQTRSRFRLDLLKCTGCRDCEQICPVQAIEVQCKGDFDDLVSDSENKIEQLTIDYGKCIHCGWCVDICEPHALFFERKKTPVFQEKRELNVGLVHLKTVPQIKNRRSH